MAYFIRLDHPRRFYDVPPMGRAEKLGVEFLGELPLDIAIRETSDSGHPIVASDPHSAHAKVYRAIAERVWSKLGAGERTPPRIVVQ